ncbi:MAG TPA: tyrosine-type recombinase/integrase [Candidatus Dormibacteraeota bacterium]|nr:tyrosine-type recombinase/integrase [Candidatus Dormibacteraeota bacterium]
MSIYRRKSGRYAVLVDLESLRAGARRRKSIGTFATRKEAERAERDALHKRDNGDNLARERMTVAELWEREVRDPKDQQKKVKVGFKPDYAAVRLTANTAHRYAELWRLHVEPEIGSVELRKLRPVHLENLYARVARKKGRNGTLSQRTVHHVHRLAFEVLSWAERLDLVARNVARRVTAPTPNPSAARALSSEEAATLLAATEGERWHPFFVFALSTGMRRGEIAGLMWDAIDRERGIAVVRQAIATDRKGGFVVKTTKTGRERIVPLSAAAVEALRRQRATQAADELAAREGTYATSNLVFADELGLPTLDAATKAFGAAVRRLGLHGVTLHSCRHYVATQALANGSDVRSVAALLGHNTPTLTLNTYGHVIAGAQERAVASVADSLEAAQARHAKAANRAG